MSTSLVTDLRNSTRPEAFSDRTSFRLFRLSPGNALALGILYLFIQRLLRNHRQRRLLTQYRKETAAPNRRNGDSPPAGEARQGDGRLGLDLGKMSLTQASKIQKELASLEFPYTFGHSLELGFIQVRIGLPFVKLGFR